MLPAGSTTGSPRATFLEAVPLTVGWGVLHQLTLRQCSTNLPTGQSYPGKFSTEVVFSGDSRLCQPDSESHLGLYSAAHLCPDTASSGCPDDLSRADTAFLLGRAWTDSCFHLPSSAEPALFLPIQNLLSYKRSLG